MTESQLVTIEKLTPQDIYALGKPDELLEKIETEVRSFIGDVTTKKGRDAIISLAYKISQSKGFLDKAGQSLTDEQRKYIDEINAGRKKFRDRLDLLRDEVREPVTQWENIEKNRVAALQEKLKQIINFGHIKFDETSAQIHDRLVEFQNFTPDDFDWQEFKTVAEKEISETFTIIDNAYRRVLKTEEDSAILKRFQEAEAERQRKENEDRIAKEAADAATAEAERVASENARKLEQQAEDARKAAETAENDRLAAIAQAKTDADAAEERRIAAVKKAKEDAAVAVATALAKETKRLADETAAIAEATRKREENQNHKKKINNEVLIALCQIEGVGETVAMAVITAIAKGEVPNVKIMY